jgi:glycosyltransferase involved in cell wall biosynthesis
MRLLSIVWFKVLPARFGGQKGTALFNQYLGEAAPTVCLASKDNVPDGPLSYRLRAELPVGKKSVLLPEAWRKIRRVALQERPTHILLEYPYHAFAAWRAARTTGAWLILHTHNIEFRRFRELGNRWWRLLRRYERWAHRRADLVLFKTETEARLAQSDFGIAEHKCLIVPYGIEPHPENSPLPDIRKQLDIPGATPLLLFAGTLDYAPNAAAVTALYKELAPRLDKAFSDYRILVCGRNRKPRFGHLNALHHPRIIRCGEVESLAPYYAAANLFINPVLSGGGVQTKNIDALAQQRTVVAFTFAAQGIDPALAGSKLQVVANGDWDAFAAAIGAALTDRSKTPDAFFEHYSWPRITARVLERLKQLS